MISLPHMTYDMIWITWVLHKTGGFHNENSGDYQAMAEIGTTAPGHAFPGPKWTSRSAAGGPGRHVMILSTVKTMIIMRYYEL